jgi:hypothetical protein
MILNRITYGIFTFAIIVVFINDCIGQNDAAYLNSYSSPDGYYMVSLPQGWNVDGFKCNGITAQDNSNQARGISYLSRLHEGVFMLPSGISPESYLENYMAQDFSLGGNDVREMKFIGYEDSSFYNNQDIATLLIDSSFAGIPTSTKAMRCSFKVNGFPAEGSFVVRTKDLLGYGTQIDGLFGIYAPSDQFDADVPMLLESFNSVEFNPSYRNICIPPIGGCDGWNCNDNTCCSHQCDELGYCNAQI